MHLLIINCSPRVKAKSNTNIVVNAFAEGYTKEKNTVEIYHLSELGKWEEIRRAFYRNENILMAIPLYVECIPGILIEFLESLDPGEVNAGGGRMLSFILQGGFPEASQLRCGEKYLEKLPSFLNCAYGGTLIKGNLFITHMMPKETADKMVAPFIQMGAAFARNNGFSKEEANRFAAPEFLSKPSVVISTLFGPLKKVFFNIFFHKNGCRGKLTDRPYEKYLHETEPGNVPRQSD